MLSFPARFGQAIVRFRLPVLLLSVVLLGFAAAGGRFLVMNDDYRYFFKEGNPQLDAFNALQNTYNKNDNILFVVAPEEGDVFQAPTLAAIETLTEKAWQIPFAVRVDSVTNFQHTYAEEDDLIVADLVEDALTRPAPALAAARDVATSEPLLVNRLVSENAGATGVNVTLELPGKEMGEQAPAVAYARKLVSEMSADYPHLEFRLTGFVMLNNAFQEASMHDMQTLVPLMYLMIMVIMAFLLRSVSGTLTTMTVVAASIMATMGITGWLGIPLSPPSAIAPTLVMTLAVADSIHILVTVLQNMRAGMSKHDALRESLRINIQPVFLTSLTTVIGFLSLNFADVQPLNDLGNITAIGVTLAFVFSITLLPAMVALLPLRVKQSASSTSGMDRWADFVVARRNPILAVSVVIVVVMAILVPRNQLNDDFVAYFDDSVAFRQDTDFATEHLTGIYQLEFSLPAGESGGISEPDYLNTLDRFAAWYHTQDHVIHVDTLSETMKRLNKNMHGDDPAYYRLPDSRELAAQYLLLYEMSLPYGLDLNNRINVDKSATRFVVTADNLTTGEIRELTEAGEAWLAANAPEHMHVRGAGPPVMFAYLSLRNSISMFQGTLLAFLLITFTLIIAVRSWKYGWMSLIPNMVPSIVAFGFWALFSGTINFGLTIVSALSIGIVVDDTVHFLSKYLRARREKGLDAEGAIRYAFNTVGRAMMVTTTVLISGFLVLLFSSFDMNAGMGKLTAMTIAIALIADFLFLPALLLKMGEVRTAPVKTPAELNTRAAA